MAGKIDKALQQLFKRSVATKIVWQNASPKSAFVQQGITVEDCDAYCVHAWTHLNDGGNKFVTIVFKGSRDVMLTKGFSSEPLKLVERAVKYENGKLQFSKAYIQNSYGADTENNTCAVPVTIYGIILSGGGVLLKQITRRIKAIFAGRRCLLWQLAR